jgi:hypothetical protein
MLPKNKFEVLAFVVEQTHVTVVSFARAARQLFGRHVIVVRYSHYPLATRIPELIHLFIFFNKRVQSLKPKLSHVKRVGEYNSTFECIRKIKSCRYNKMSDCICPQVGSSEGSIT